jgi:hypothetical protein
MILTWTESLAAKRTVTIWLTYRILHMHNAMCHSFRSYQYWCLNGATFIIIKRDLQSTSNTVPLFEAIFYNETFEYSDPKYFIKKIWFNCNRLCFLVFLLQTHLRIHSYRSENKKNLIHTTSGWWKTCAHQNDIVWTLFDLLSTIFIHSWVILIL